MGTPRSASHVHARFVQRTVEVISADPRFVGVALAGSWASDTMDAFSDLDFVLAVEEHAFDEILREREAIARRLGHLIVGFTGEHVGEPRLFICLYDRPLLHVDLKILSIADTGRRVDEPAVVWERDGRLAAAFGQTQASFPQPDPQWVEDRFWVWIHYGASKVARGELFEAVEMLSFLRVVVLGPLGLAARGAKPAGVRLIEQVAPDLARVLQGTVASYDAAGCFDALSRCVTVYRELRGDVGVRRLEAEAAAVAYLEAERLRTENARAHRTP